MVARRVSEGMAAPSLAYASGFQQMMNHPGSAVCSHNPSYRLAVRLESLTYGPPSASAKPGT